MPRNDFYGWKLLGILWLILITNLGFPAFGSPVIHTYMVKALHLDRALAGLPYSVYTVMAGLPGPLVALSVLKIGVRRTMVLGGLLVCLGSLAMAFLVKGIVGAIIASGVIVGAGVIAGGPIGAQPAVAEWFVRRRALALSILYSGGGIGGFLAAPLLERLIRHFDGNWRVGWMVVAGLTVISIVLTALFVRNRPADLGQLPDGGPASSAAGKPARPPAKFITTETWTHRELLRSRALWAMVISACGGGAGFMLFMSHGLLHLEDLGHSPATAAWSVSIFTIAGLLTQPVLGLLGDRIDPRYLWAFTLFVFAVGLVLIVDARSTASLYAFAICLGFGFACGMVCMMAVFSNYYGVHVFPTAAGIASAVNTSVGFLAPLVAGLLFDKLGSYRAAFYTAAAWCFVGAVVLAVLRRPALRAEGRTRTPLVA